MIADELRLAGLKVIEGRDVGRLTDVKGVDVKPTGRPASEVASVVVNEVVAPARGAFFIERSGRVWMLASGPVGDQSRALVFVAGESEADRSEDASDALAALLAVLSGAYGEMPERPEPPSDVTEEPPPSPPRKRPTKKAAAEAAAEGDNPE
jgi:hypothetical protein